MTGIMAIGAGTKGSEGVINLDAIPKEFIPPVLERICFETTRMDPGKHNVRIDQLEPDQKGASNEASHGAGTARNAEENIRKTIKSYLSRQPGIGNTDVCLLFSSLGGTGCGAAPLILSVIPEEARHAGIGIPGLFPIFTIPATQVDLQDSNFDKQAANAACFFRRISALQFVPVN